MNFKKTIERILFGSRWLLTLFYAGLILALLCYGFIYAKETWHMVHEANQLTAEAMMVVLLELVDMVMIANLVKMIITGSYHAFISKEHDYPEEKASSGLLKVKLSTSLIGVTAIHLLQTFVSMAVKPVSWDELLKQITIHSTFLIGALILAVIEYLHEKGQSLSNNH
jgi:uncharacterized protein (TIGR00645 family)